jgi:hypothetical protein
VTDEEKEICCSGMAIEGDHSTWCDAGFRKPKGGPQVEVIRAKDTLTTKEKYTKDLKDYLAAKDLAAIRRSTNKAITKKIIDCSITKDARLSLHGVQRWPITLYVDQWEFIIRSRHRIMAFIEAHKELAR